MVWKYTNISKNMNMFKEHVKYTTLQSSVQWLSALIRIINDNHEIWFMSHSNDYTKKQHIYTK